MSCEPLIYQPSLRLYEEMLCPQIFAEDDAGVKFL